MDFDLLKRSSKLEKEKLERREAAKRKLDREQKLRDDQRARDLQLEQEAFQKKIDEERMHEEKLAAEREELELTGGIHVQESNLQVYEISDANDDKIILPESILQKLLQQDAYSKGPMYFRLSGSIHGSENEVLECFTHAGVREFTATEGTVGLPRKIIDSLTRLHAEYQLLHVTIKYIRLPKITYVKLRPIANDFFSVGPVKMCLEENLRLHATLTLHDIMTVWYRGKSHQLRVIEMKPADQGSLIDSDVEVDLDVSEESVKHAQESASSRINTASITRRLDEETASPILPPEPEVGRSDVIAVKIKTPNGQTISRRFSHSDPIKVLFYLVGSIMKEDVRRLQLTQRFPARAFTYNASLDTFENVGITSSQEVFMATVV